MLKKIYGWIYRATARADERGEYSGGRLEGAIRQEALALCALSQGRILEIGCGSGLFVLKLAAERPELEVCGVDNNEAMVAEVREKSAARGLKNLQVFCQDAKALSFESGSFDRVVCINLFLNIDFESVKALLEEMKRVCNASGRIIFEFRNSRNLLFVLKYKLARYYDQTVPYPLYTYDPDKIEGLVKDIGLETTKRKRLGLFGLCAPCKSCAPIVLIEARKI